MAYDRYDTREAPRDERSRWSSDRNEDRSRGGGSGERGFFERAGDEIASWFGDSDAERRRNQDQSHDGRSESQGRYGSENRSWQNDRDRSQDRGGWDRGRMSSDHSRDRDPGQARERGWSGDSDRNRDLDRGWFGGGGSREHEDRDFHDRGWERGQGRGYSASDRDYNPSWRQELGGRGGGDWNQRERSQDRNRGFGGGERNQGYRGGSDQDRGYRPMAGDYGRGSNFGRAGQDRSDTRGQRGFGDYSRDDDGQSEWGRDQYRSTSRAGTSDWTDRSRHEDPHYDSWRQRHMSELDRDYDDFRREHQSRFEHDFAGWREQRQQKRGLLGQIREHMEVIGSDEKHVGKVDKVAGDRIILAKSDPDSGGMHHSIGCSDIDRIDNDRVVLGCSADQARQRWHDERDAGAMFERDDQQNRGPRNLNRSFEGTYR